MNATSWGIDRGHVGDVMASPLLELLKTSSGCLVRLLPAGLHGLQWAASQR